MPRKLRMGDKMSEFVTREEFEELSNKVDSRFWRLLALAHALHLIQNDVSPSEILAELRSILRRASKASSNNCRNPYNQIYDLMLHDLTVKIKDHLSDNGG